MVENMEKYQFTLKGDLGMKYKQMKMQNKKENKDIKAVRQRCDHYASYVVKNVT